MKQNNDMRYVYKRPRMEVADIALQQIICSSGGWAEMGSYGSNTGSGFSQTPPF